MSRYIDKDLLEKKLLSMYDETQPRSEYNAGYDDCICTVQDMVSDMPEADVVEIVRCKDCEHCEEGICGYTESGHKEDWFCVKPVEETMGGAREIMEEYKKKLERSRNNDRR